MSLLSLLASSAVVARGGGGGGAAEKSSADATVGSASAGAEVVVSLPSVEAVVIGGAGADGSDWSSGGAGVTCC